LIDPLAYIHPDAVLGRNVKVGPWSYIGADVSIGDDCIIESHVVIKGPSIIGEANHFFQFSSVGEQCQDIKYAGEKTQLIMGDRNTIREGVTIHRGTIQDQGITKIGSDNLLMANVHVAHDCVIGNQCILANSVNLAGHVEIDDFAILGGMSGVHQFVKIGAHSFIGAILAIRRGFKTLYKQQLPLDEALNKLSDVGNKHVDYFVSFIQKSSRGIIR